VSSYKYEEPDVMTNKGTLYGIFGSYTFRGSGQGSLTPFGADPNDALSFEGRLAFGEVDYEGSLMDGTPYEASGNDDFLFDIRLLWSRQQPEAQIFNGVYAGLGYRYLNDDSSGDSYGYERESNYLYVPIGMRKDWRLQPRWRLSLTGELDVLLVGYQVSHLDPTIRNWQWPGVGGVVSLELQHRGDNIDLGVAPFVRYWWIDESSVEDGYYEPENNTVEYGLSFIFRF
jgi:hypothetical protein